MLAGRLWRKWGREIMKMMLTRNYDKFITGSEDICGISLIFSSRGSIMKSSAMRRL